MEAPFGNIQQARWDHMQRLWDEYREDTDSAETAAAEKKIILETAIIGWARVAVRGQSLACEMPLPQSVSIAPEDRIVLPDHARVERAPESRRASALKAVETRRRRYGSGVFSEMGRKGCATRWLRSERLGKGKLK